MKLLSYSSSIMISSMIMLITVISNVNCLSFNFPDFYQTNQTIKYEGAASSVNSTIQLTPNRLFQTGHATYKSELMHLWKKSSKILSDFNTNFSFSIDKQNNSIHADGFAFFMASPQYEMPSNEGRGLGLASGDLNYNPTANPFVAVEFDTCPGEWDADTDHVAFDINSLKSSKSAKWFSALDGRILNARITYSSSSKNLCAYYTGNVTYEQHLCYEVDLSLYLPEWVVLGFSAATGSASEIHRIHSWSFSSSFPPSNEKNKTAIIAGVVVGVFILVLVIFVGVYYYYRNNIWSEGDEENAEISLTKDCNFSFMAHDPGFKRVIGAKKIPHAVLADATNNFDEKEKLGQGGFGAVFRGYLKDLETHVAVKRISENSTLGISGYIAEVMILSQLRHRNLVQLYGWCHEKNDILLVYEFIPNRSLDFHLFSGQSLLKWEQRYKIAQGLAYGLEYLHVGWRQCVLHRDIKASNVMLDFEFNSMLGDFGLARIVDHDARSQTLLGGSHGYIAPECHETGKSSKESDVYSFGVVALEIACGRKPFVPRVDDDDQVHIVRWVWEFYGNGELLKAADENLDGKFSEKQMERLLIVGMWCAHPDHFSRPSMREAINVLNFEGKVPDLPSKFPAPTHYYPTFSDVSSNTNTIRNNVSYSSHSSRL